MGLTKTAVAGPYSIGDRWETINKFDFDSSYPTGGESLTRATLGFSSAPDSEFSVEAEPTLGYVCRYDHTNQKLLVYDQKDPAAAGGADIALPEVGDTVSLAALVGVRVTAKGRYLA